MCPVSLVNHWNSEIKRYFGNDPIFRTFIVEKNALTLPMLTESKFNVIIVSDRNLIKNIAVLKQVHYLCAIFDEAHLLKNDKNRLSICVKELNCKHRLALTGTPIQNNLLELWSIFDILMPSYLGSKDEFKKSFSKLFNLSLLS